MRDASTSAAGSGRLVRFACVGGVGFAIDAGILTFLVNGLEWGVYVSRAISFGAAVTCTWYSNRHWVFFRTRSGYQEYGRYFTVQAIGAVLNLCVYVALIQSLSFLAAVPVVPLAAGATLALLFNYLAATRFVFDPSTM